MVVVVMRIARGYSPDYLLKEVACARSGAEAPGRRTLLQPVEEQVGEQVGREMVEREGALEPV